MDNGRHTSYCIVRTLLPSPLQVQSTTGKTRVATSTLATVLYCRLQYQYNSSLFIPVALSTFYGRSGNLYQAVGTTLSTY
jgi:hypothetical protein